RNTPPRSANKPKAFTPSKAVRILISQLAATTSGSYLVSDSPLKSTIPIISPIIETPPNYQFSDWDAEEITSNIAKFTKEELAAIIIKMAEELTFAQLHLLARNSAITRLQAQLIIQNMHLIK
ncbi:hypothetical protein M422DRAFT_136086, partial [Sphaerobolus stellatus SS14]